MSGSGFVLVVDDDQDILDMTRIILETSGYVVHTATNGKDALQTCRGTGRACLVLLDLVMPTTDGWWYRSEVARDPTLADIPIVVLSGADLSEDKVAALGVAAFLSKPFGVEALLSTVRRF